MASRLSFGLTMLALFFSPLLLAAQSARAPHARDIVARESWHNAGRSLPDRAGLRRKAIQQKLAGPSVRRIVEDPDGTLWDLYRFLPMPVEMAFKTTGGSRAELRRWQSIPMIQLGIRCLLGLPMAGYGNPQML